MNHEGEIRPLTKMVRPHAVVVTTVGPVHTEISRTRGRGGRPSRGVRRLEPGGVAVLNADNAWFGLLKAEAEKAGATVRSFGTGEGCDARLIDFQVPGPHAVIQARLHGKRWTSRSADRRPLGPEQHGRAADAGGPGRRSRRQPGGAGGVRAAGGRGAEKTVRLAGGGFTLIDESYNANPISMASAIATLGARGTANRRIVALTDMLELGPSDDVPRRPGRAAGRGVNRPRLLRRSSDEIALGRPSCDSARRLRRNGCGARAAARTGRRGRRRVMVKGSNGSKAGLIAQALAQLDSAHRSWGGALMFYWLYLAFGSTHYVPILNLLKYQTFRTGLAIFTAQIVVVALGSRFIPLDEGPPGQGPADPRRGHRAPHHREGRHADHGRGDDPGRAVLRDPCCGRT